MAPGIIAFCKDWDDDPTSNHHVLRGLARERRVLWLNSVGTRQPSLANGRDLQRVARKLRQFARGPVQVESDLHVFTPLVLPFPHSRMARRFNRVVLGLMLRALKRRLGMREFHLWTFLPNVADYVGTLGESFSVYYCTDEHAMFTSFDADGTLAAERELLARVDCVFATNRALAEAKRPLNPEMHCSPHGVSHALFARALDPETRVPADVAALPRPVLGFFGTIEDWVDFDLIAHVARRRPEWTIVLIGQQIADSSAIEQLPNVHLLGRRRHEQLPAYCRGFDVGLIPYRISDQLPFRNPIKLREYLSAGLPVVATEVPDVREYGRWCTVADGADEFVSAVEAALADNSEGLRRARSEAMAGETWTARVAEIAQVIEGLETRRREPAAERITDNGHAPAAGTAGAGRFARRPQAGVRKDTRRVGSR